MANKTYNARTLLVPAKPRNKRLREIGYQGGSSATVDVDLTPYLLKATFDDLFEKVNIGTDSNPKWSIKAKYGLWTEQFLSAKGVEDGETQGGIDYEAVQEMIAEALQGYNPSTGSIDWDSITGKPDVFTPASHAHTWDSITGKPSTFAPSSHSHTKADITDFAHGHGIADVTGLQDALAGKVPTTRTITAGAGLTGGGTLAADRTISLNATNAVLLQMLSDMFEWQTVNGVQTIKAKASLWTEGYLSAKGVEGEQSGGSALDDVWSEIDALGRWRDTATRSIDELGGKYEAASGEMEVFKRRDFAVLDHGVLKIVHTDAHGTQSMESVGAGNVGARPSSWLPSKADIEGLGISVPWGNVTGKTARKFTVGGVEYEPFGAADKSFSVDVDAATGTFTIGSKTFQPYSAKNKPTASDVGARPSTWTPTASDVGVPAWAQAATKPTYTAAEVGARPSTWTPSASDVGADPAGTAASAASAAEVAAKNYANGLLQIGNGSNGGKLATLKIQLNGSDVDMYSPLATSSKTINVAGVLTTSNYTDYAMLKAHGANHDPNTLIAAGSYRLDQPTAHAPRGNWGQMLSVHGSQDTFGQLYFPFDDNPLQWRGGAGVSNGQTTSDAAWRSILDSGNYSSYALPLSGGTMTGGITMGNKAIYGENGAGLLVHHPPINSWTGADNTKWSVGTIDSQGVIRSDNTDLIHYRNGNATAARVILDAANYSSYALPLTGGTLTGTLHTASNKHLGSAGINMHNSDITNVNCIITSDSADSFSEGIFFKRDNDNYDILTASGGNLYFKGNATGNEVFSTGNIVLHSGNYNSYALPLTGGTLTGNLTVNGQLKLESDNSYVFMRSGRVGPYLSASDSALNISWHDASNSYTKSLAYFNNNGDFRVYGNIFFDGNAGGVFLKDSSSTMFGGIYYNGTNLWIGATETVGYHHTGATYISAGMGKGLYCCVPSAENYGGTSYEMLHAGNYTDYAKPPTDNAYDLGTQEKRWRYGLFGWVGNKAGADFSIGGNYAAHLTCKADGKVGIGTSSPSYKLDIAGTARATGDLRANSWVYVSEGTARRMVFGCPTDSTYGFWQLRDGDTVKNKIHLCDDRVYMACKYLNIGEEIDPYDSRRNEIALLNAADQPTMIRLGCNGAMKWGIETRASGDSYAFSIYSWAASTHVLRILSDGNVGIGTTSPDAKLHVAGAVHATTGVYTEGYVTAQQSASSSDIRLKDIIGDYGLSVEKIANAPSVRFAWKDSGREDIGSIAQYWQDVSPHSVLTDPHGNLSLQYGKLGLLASISVARRELELEAEVERLKQEVEQLKAQIA